MGETHKNNINILIVIMKSIDGGVCGLNARARAISRLNKQSDIHLD